MEEHKQQQQQHIILFYKYHPLSVERTATEIFRTCLERLCRALHLSGRILVGCSKNEGINGTLAGSYHRVKAFTVALSSSSMLEQLSEDHRRAVERYWAESQAFFASIDSPVLQMTAQEFKWSSNNSIDDSDQPLFPDLNIKLVKELISSGGAMSAIPLEETSQGYLTPEEWHDALTRLEKNSNEDDIVLIDCRNTKEFQIGHFNHAIDPMTTTFAQFPSWVQANEHLLAQKKVYMYCTGGIRCEKASAFIRRQVRSVQHVKHLQGGIHKYLEMYGDDSEIWKGRNFVFDGRGATTGQETRLGRDDDKDNGSISGLMLSPEEEKANSSSEMTNCLDDAGHSVVGRCVSCHRPHDVFDPHVICTVCREPTLVCLECRKNVVEYHCRQHENLRNCYFSDLSRFSEEELNDQIRELKSIFDSFAVGRHFKSKRKTILKQIGKIREHSSHHHPINETLPNCRNCGVVGCSGRCWGFHGLKRKEVLERNNESSSKKDMKLLRISQSEVSGIVQVNVSLKREKEVEEITALRLSLPPTAFRNQETGVRVPPCTTRVVQCFAKAKWCGQQVTAVMKEEFAELSRPGALQEVLQQGLLRVNGKSINPANASHVRIRMGDVISRIIHWHEPPVLVPSKIGVKKFSLPERVVKEYGLDPSALVFACNKPASVPVHPAGPYLANTLTMMVEAQEELPCLSLTPLHRTDRVASGLTLCSTDSAITRVFQTSLTNGHVRKLYLGRVCGKFYNKTPEDFVLPSIQIGQCQWRGDDIEVDAPVETIDPANGIRAVTLNGKPSRSLFKLLTYNPVDDTSLVACCPVTGRSHQLRVHLQLLGFPLLGDRQYGGRRSNVEQSRIESTALQMMQNSIQEADNDALSLLSLTDDDIKAAKRACSCCRSGEGGISAAFTQPQLLQGGHSIYLHALRYQVSIFPKKKSQQPMAVLEFHVDPPSWAEPGQLQNLDLSWFEQRACTSNS